MHLLKEGERLVVMLYHAHCCSTPGSVVKDHQHNLQDKFITFKGIFGYILAS